MYGYHETTVDKSNSVQTRVGKSLILLEPLCCYLQTHERDHRGQVFRDIRRCLRWFRLQERPLRCHQNARHSSHFL